MYKSLTYLPYLEFIEQDSEGMKMRVRTEFVTGDFPYEVGYLEISNYDDRKFLVTKVDPEHHFVWFGIWDE